MQPTLAWLPQAGSRLPQKGNQILVLISTVQTRATLAVAALSLGVSLASGVTAQANPHETPNAVSKQETPTRDASKIIGYYYIKARSSGKCLQDPGWSTAKNTVVSQWSCLHQRNEWWDLKYAGRWKGANLVNLKNVYSGLCAAVKGGSRANGTPIVQWKCSSDNSKWWITHVTSSGGYEWYNLHNLNTGKCLNVAGNSKANGAWLVEYDCVHAANEHFTFPHKP